MSSCASPWGTVGWSSSGPSSWAGFPRDDSFLKRRLSSLIIKVTIFKSAIQGLLVLSRPCAKTSFQFQDILISPKGNPEPLKKSLPTLASLQPLSTTTFFLSPWTCFSRHSCKWTPTICDGVWLLSLGMFLRFIQAVARVGTAFLLMAESESSGCHIHKPASPPMTRLESYAYPLWSRNLGPQLQRRAEVTWGG